MVKEKEEEEEDEKRRWCTSYSGSLKKSSRGGGGGDDDEDRRQRQRKKMCGGFGTSFLEIVEKIWDEEERCRKRGSVVVCVGGTPYYAKAAMLKTFFTLKPTSLEEEVEEEEEENEASASDTSDDENDNDDEDVDALSCGRETSDAREIARIGSKSSRAFTSERRETREKVFANSRRGKRRRKFVAFNDISTQKKQSKRRRTKTAKRATTDVSTYA